MRLFMSLASVTQVAEKDNFLERNHQEGSFEVMLGWTEAAVEAITFLRQSVGVDPAQPDG